MKRTVASALCCGAVVLLSSCVPEEDLSVVNCTDRQYVVEVSVETDGERSVRARGVLRPNGVLLLEGAVYDLPAAKFTVMFRGKNSAERTVSVSGTALKNQQWIVAFCDCAVLASDEKRPWTAAMAGRPRSILMLPPRNGSFSTTAVFRPSCPALMAAT